MVIDKLITDFSICKTINGQEISGAEVWKLIKYRSDSISGTMLYAPSQEVAEDIILPLNVKGWHKIYLGLYNEDFKTTEIKVRLTLDDIFRKVCTIRYNGDKADSIEEGFWKFADLTGQDLVISKAGKKRGTLAYIRLVPVSQTELDEYRNYHKDKKCYKLGAVMDVFQLLCEAEEPFSHKTIHEIINPYIESDFNIICWGVAAGDRYLYHTQVGDMFGSGKKDFYRPAHKTAADFLAFTVKEGWDPLREAVEYAHENNMELYGDFRIGHTYDVNKYCGDVCSEFQKNHQDCYVKEKDGSVKACFLSLAYEEVREHKVALIKEILERDVDGIYIDFMRFSPVVYYEQPLLDGFKEKYNKDPRDLEPTNMDWLKFRAGFVTRFMRQVKEAVKAEEMKRGKKIKIVVQTEYGYSLTQAPNHNIIDLNLEYGYDLKEWANEGLVDIIAISKSARLHITYNLDFYKDLINGTECELWPVLGQHDATLFPLDYDWEEYFVKGDVNDPRKQMYQLNSKKLSRVAADCYAQGAEGSFLWEAGGNYCYLHRWEELCKLGHKHELLKKWGEEAARYEHIPNITAQDVVMIE